MTSPIVSPDDVPDVKADDVAASVAGAMDAAQARYESHQAELGTVMNLPPVVSDWSQHTGGTDAASYDPAG